MFIKLTYQGLGIKINRLLETHFGIILVDSHLVIRLNGHTRFRLYTVKLQSYTFQYNYQIEAFK